jgi:uncharacterized OB-fold protein
VSADPQPRATPDNAPMLAAWRAEGALELQRCSSCGRAVFYPRAICPYCWSAALRWFRSTGRGRIVSYSRIHRGLAECFQPEAPIVLAEIRLEEEAAMIARVIAPDPDEVHSGMEVELIPLPEAARFPLPTFRPR